MALVLATGTAPRTKAAPGPKPEPIGGRIFDGKSSSWQEWSAGPAVPRPAVATADGDQHVMIAFPLHASGDGDLANLRVTVVHVSTPRPVTTAELRDLMFAARSKVESDILKLGKGFKGVVVIGSQERRELFVYLRHGTWQMAEAAASQSKKSDIEFTLTGGQQRDVIAQEEPDLYAELAGELLRCSYNVGDVAASIPAFSGSPAVTVQRGAGRQLLLVDEAGVLIQNKQVRVIRKLAIDCSILVGKDRRFIFYAAVEYSTSLKSAFCINTIEPGMHVAARGGKYYRGFVQGVGKHVLKDNVPNGFPEQTYLDYNSAWPARRKLLQGASLTEKLVTVAKDPEGNGMGVEYPRQALFKVIKLEDLTGASATDARVRTHASPATRVQYAHAVCKALAQPKLLLEVGISVSPTLLSEADLQCETFAWDNQVVAGSGKAVNANVDAASPHSAAIKSYGPALLAPAFPPTLVVLRPQGLNSSDVKAAELFAGRFKALLEKETWYKPGCVALLKHVEIATGKSIEQTVKQQLDALKKEHR